MRIVIGYPSLDDPRGFVQVSQNRQSKIFSVGEEAAIFPCVMAWAATMLKAQGHEVIWQDGPAEGLPWLVQLGAIQRLQPDLVVWEVKTPSAPRAYMAVNRLKQALPGTIVVLVGDHVTALPEEALKATGCAIITGGDYDFGLLEFLEPPRAWDAPQIFHQPTDTPITTLPTLDRTLCKWK